MFYEMKSSESVQRVLEFAGGFTGDAYTKNVRLIRKAGQEYSIHTIEEFEMNGFTLADGDSLFVDSVIPVSTTSLRCAVRSCIRASTR